MSKSRGAVGRFAGADIELFLVGIVRPAMAVAGTDLLCGMAVPFFDSRALEDSLAAFLSRGQFAIRRAEAVWTERQSNG